MLVEKEFASLRRRYRTQKTLRHAIEDTWDEIEKFTGPIAEAGTTHSTTGDDNGFSDRSDVWDFTAIDGREKLASSIHVSVTNPWVRWFLLAYRAATLNRDTEARTWMDEESENVWNDLQDSDFDVEIATSYFDLAGPGCCYLSIEPITGPPDPKTLKETWEGPDFTNIPLREGFHEPDRKGQVKVFWRRLMWTPGQVIDWHESKGLTPPEDIVTKHDQGDENKIEVVFCVFPRPKIQARKKVTYPAPADKRPWGCVWWREDTGDQLGEENGYYEKPITFCRWSKTGGSKWGHGPGNMSLPTVRYVNAWLETYKTAGEKAVDPVVLANQRDLIENVDLTPGALTMCRDVQGFKVLESGAKFEVGENIIDDCRMQIRQLFRTDDLQMKDSPAMTATEAQIRYELMNRILGKTLTFIQRDLLAFVIETILHMRKRLGASKPMPKRVEAAGGVYNIEYQGPMARSQRTDEVAAIERGAAFVAGLTQFYPKARAAFDPIKAIKHVFNRLGIPADVIPNDSELKKIMDQMDQQEARAIAADAAAKEAKAGKDAASIPPSASGGIGAVAEGAGYPPLPPTPPLSVTTGQPAVAGLM